MGINAEFIEIVLDQKCRGTLRAGGSVIELGAQVLCVASEVATKMLSAGGVSVPAEPVYSAATLYRALGFDAYRAIDASGENGALPFDLNQDIAETYGFADVHDLVTNLGTAEHCFDQKTVFKNIHKLCKIGGMMIHAAPSAGNFNHGFYNYHPRIFAELAHANGYAIEFIGFTSDYTPNLMTYSLEKFKAYDSRDILLYVAMRKLKEQPFQLPYDGMFSATCAVPGYVPLAGSPLDTEFAPYLKTGDWANTRGLNYGAPAASRILARLREWQRAISRGRR